VLFCSFKKSLIGSLDAELDEIMLELASALSED